MRTERRSGIDPAHRRLIGEVGTQDSGRTYLNNRFYQPDRVLDGDAFYVAINR